MAIQRRSGRYYSRVKVPARLRRIIGKTEIVRSLQTTRLADARVRAVAWEGRLAALFFNLRCGFVAMDKSEIDRIIQAHVAECDEAHERQLTEGFIGNADMHEAISMVLTGLLEDNADDLATGQYRRVKKDAQELLAKHGKVLDPSSYEFKQFCRAYLIAEQHMLRRQHDRLQGNYSDVLLQPPRSDGPDTGTSSPLLSKAIEDFKSRQVATNAWSPKTQQNAVKAFERLLETTSDKPVGRVTSGELSAHIEALKVRRGKGGRPFADSSIQKDLNTLTGFFNWLVEQNRYPQTPFQSFALIVWARHTRSVIPSPMQT